MDPGCGRVGSSCPCWQYDHIKKGLKKQGRSEDTAEEIAARTVSKERARSGEAKQKSRPSTDDISSSRRGGLRSHQGPGGRTRVQLYEEAKKKNVQGRSTMKKAQLEKAVGSLSRSPPTSRGIDHSGLADELDARIQHRHPEVRYVFLDPTPPQSVTS